MSIEKSRKQDAEANVRKGMTLITCTLQVKKKSAKKKNKQQKQKTRCGSKRQKKDDVNNVYIVSKKKKNPQRSKINNKKMLSPLIEKNPIEKAKVRTQSVLSASRFSAFGSASAFAGGITFAFTRGRCLFDCSAIKLGRQSCRKAT